MDGQAAWGLPAAHGVKDEHGRSWHPHRPRVFTEDGVSVSEDVGLYLATLLRLGGDAVRGAAAATASLFPSRKASREEEALPRFPLADTVL